MGCLSWLERLVQDNAEVSIFIFAFLNETQIVTFSVRHSRYTQRTEEIERYNACARDEILERDFIGGGEVGAFDRRIDFVMSDIDDATVFRTRSRAFFVLVFAMKRGPDAAVRFAVTHQRDFFGHRALHAEWLELIDQFAETLAVDEGVEETFVTRVVDVVQDAQFAVIAQPLTHQILVAAITIACLIGAWAAGLHRRIWRSFDFLEGLVGEAEHESGELFGDAVLAGEDPHAVLLRLRRRHHRHLAAADEHGASGSVFDWSDEIDVTRLQRESCCVAFQCEIVDRSVWATEI